MAKAPSRIHEEIKQRRPFPSLAQEAFVALLRTTDMARQVAIDCIGPHGVTLQQYNVLRILRGAEPDGLPTLDIAETMIEKAPGITRLLDRLEAKRLVARERCPTDRRQVTCRISRMGLELLAKLDPLVDRADESITRGLTRAEQRTFVALLDRIRAGLKQS